MAYLSSQDKEVFHEQGFFILKDFFPESEIDELRAKVDALRKKEESRGNVNTRFNGRHTYWTGDIAGKDGLEYLLFDPRIVSVAKEMLGPDLVYYGDSSVSIGESGRSLHRDNTDRKDPNGPDWEGPYQVMRFGIYFQDHARHSGGLKVRAGSHLASDFIEGRNPVKEGRGRLVNIPGEKGDLLFWSERIVHSGNAVRLRVFPNIVFDPRYESKIPNFLRVPEEHERMAIFMSFAAPSLHLDRHVDYQVGRGDYVDHWKKSRHDEEISRLADGAGIEIRKPIPEYGSLYVR